MKTIERLWKKFFERKNSTNFMNEWMKAKNEKEEKILTKKKDPNNDYDKYLIYGWIFSEEKLTDWMNE